MKGVSGIHHITAITGNPQANLDFYEGFLGQRLVKRTVNFDDPSSYHFYFGDAYGRPGTLLTFFFWPRLPAGVRGAGEVSRISYRIGRDVIDFWKTRARKRGVECSEEKNAFGESTLLLKDPDGMEIELSPGADGQKIDVWDESDVPAKSALRGFAGARLTVLNAEEMRRTLELMGYTQRDGSGEHLRFASDGDLARFLDLHEAPDLQMAQQGSGSVHHIAFRVPTDEAELALRARIEKTGLRPTHVIDRQYFHSVYFMTQGRVLFEIATDQPGFSIDEERSSLGEKLVLPPQYEPHRFDIERLLVPIRLPRHAKH